jgi:hypothetical protein
MDFEINTSVNSQSDKVELKLKLGLDVFFFH